MRPDRARLLTLAWFGLAGTLAFGVDAGVLHLVQPWLGPYGGRVVSFLCAAAFTWLFNRSVTFNGPRRFALPGEFAGYLGAMTLGGLLNLGAYAVCVRWWPLATEHPVIAVGLGGIAGMLFNYLAAERVLLRRRRDGLA